LQHAVEDQLQGFPVLVGLAVREHHMGLLVAGKGRRQALEVQRRHRLVADDGHLATDDVASQQRAVIEQAAADVDGITARSEIDVKSLHGAPGFIRGLEYPTWTPALTLGTLARARQA